MKEERKEYPIKQIRMSEITWKQFKEQKLKYGKTWNLFIKKIIDDNIENSKKIDFIMENTGKESLYSEVSGATRREYKTLKKLYSE